MINKKLLIILILVLPVTEVYSQISDTTAKWMLRQISARTKTFNCVKIEFNYRFENEKSKITEIKKGDITIKGNKYIMNIPGQTTINNGTTVWTYLPDEKEVTIKNFKETKESITPQKILCDYEKDFRPKLIREYIEKGKKYSVIDLTPKTARSFYKIRIIVDQVKKEIVSSTFYEKEGNRFTYEIIKLTPDIKADDEMFTFDTDKYPGVEVNDMR